MYQYIDGKRVTGSSTETTSLRNPVTGEVVTADIPFASESDVNLAVESARNAQKDWGRATPSERAVVMEELARLIATENDDLAAMESTQVGKPIRMTTASDIPMVADVASFFAGSARHLEGLATSEYVEGYTSSIRRDPIGVVAAIAPWNFPLLMAAWKAFPAMAAGNSVVLKPSQLTPDTSLRLAELTVQAGVPAGVLNVIFGTGPVSGHAMASHPGVNMVSFTGSTAGGRAVMQSASTHNTRVQMELGGKAPFVVFDDANLNAAIQGAVAGTITNAGQDCAAATRAYVHHSIFDEFVDGVSSILDSIKLGEPLDPATEMGPLVSLKQLAAVESAVERARAEGANIVAGGKRATEVSETGYFYRPTLITGAQQSSDLVQEEIFGPVLAVLPFGSDDEAFDLANDTQYGLVASAWTSNHFRAQRAMRELNAGCVWINDHLPLASEMPQGGIGASGFGKDLSKYSLDEYTVARHIMSENTNQAEKEWHRTLFDAR